MDVPAVQSDDQGQVGAGQLGPLGQAGAHEAELLLVAQLVLQALGDLLSAAAHRAWLPVRAELLERLAAAGRQAAPDAQVALWPPPRGTRMTARALRSVVNRIGAAAGVDVAPHVLRHSAATRWLRSGVDIEQVAELLGHADLNSTRIYTLPTEGDLAAAVEAGAVTY